MKKSILFFIVLTSILAGCSNPQVTVTPEATVTLQPTETPFPTPTLHPQFVEIQEQVSASGRRFTLQADGTIQDGTEPIPSITVAPDGTITLAIDDEIVILDPDDMTFDEENGISVKGYELDENGKWVAAESEAIQQSREDFANYGYSTEGFEFREGQVTISVFDKDGIKVYERNIKSGESMFDKNYVIEQASQMNLDPSDLGPREDILEATGQYFIDQSSWSPIFEEYVKPLMDQYEQEYGIRLPMTGPTVSFIILDPEINAWATMLKMDSDDPTAPRYLYYRDEADMGYIVPLMPEK